MVFVYLGTVASDSDSDCHFSSLLRQHLISCLKIAGGKERIRCIDRLIVCDVTTFSPLLIHRQHLDSACESSLSVAQNLPDVSSAVSSRCSSVSTLPVATDISDLVSSTSSAPPAHAREGNFLSSSFRYRG